MLKLSCLNICSMERHERIAHAITVSGLKKGDVAAYCKVANSAVTQWVNGDSKSLRPENLFALAKLTGFRAEWLAVGKGPEREQSQKESTGNVDPSVIHIGVSRPIPIVGTAQMGSEGYWYALDESEGFVQSYSCDKDAYAIRLRGDSMSPAIKSGWLAVCEPNSKLVPGEYVMVRLLDGESMLKELLYANSEEVSLMSINTAYGRRNISTKEIESIHHVGAIVPPSKICS